MDGDELELLERSLHHATGQATGPELDAELDRLGWPEALAADPRAAVSTLFALQGAAGATSAALGHVVLHALGLDGRRPAGVVLPPVGRWSPPGTIDGDGLRVGGLATAALAGLEAATVVATGPDGDVAATVATASLGLRPVEGIDPRLGLVEVTGEAVAVDTTTGVEGRWSSAVALGRLALAHEQVGAARTMLELARTHALERVQFDRPIASFQAVRHRLAEALVAVETAQAMLDAAWLDRTETTATMAKAVAGRQARVTARHCQQVLAGIGFTTEHPLHHYVRRVLVLDGLLGTSATLTAALGRQVLTDRQLPPLLPL